MAQRPMDKSPLKMATLFRIIFAILKNDGKIFCSLELSH
ncbi:hypothetical protein DBT_1271 [Dissulfuribacter thermophilus]|uniref:Uncharacterized protein n=1 Tax=Dissulfuribacter thermophilus TaxID=1156395 RepID=A0A1B9F5V6_9BACT|nr:hypothetical protein DBT_1271 [Dissulfuribacter thermophilus]